MVTLKELKEEQKDIEDSENSYRKIYGYDDYDPERVLGHEEHMHESYKELAEKAILSLEHLLNEVCDITKFELQIINESFDEVKNKDTIYWIQTCHKYNRIMKKVIGILGDAI